MPAYELTQAVGQSATLTLLEDPFLRLKGKFRDPGSESPVKTHGNVFEREARKYHLPRAHYTGMLSKGV